MAGARGPKAAASQGPGDPAAGAGEAPTSAGPDGAPAGGAPASSAGAATAAESVVEVIEEKTVEALKDFAGYFRHQLVRVAKGDILTGAVGAFFHRTGAPVKPVE